MTRRETPTVPVTPDFPSEKTGRNPTVFRHQPDRNPYSQENLSRESV